MGTWKQKGFTGWYFKHQKGKTVFDLQGGYAVYESVPDRRS